MPQWQLLSRMHNLLDQSVKDCFPALRACASADVTIAVGRDLAALFCVCPDRAKRNKLLGVVLVGIACDSQLKVLNMLNVTRLNQFCDWNSADLALEDLATEQSSAS